VLNKLDMVPLDERPALVKDFVKRYKTALKIKAADALPVFEISALTREGCEHLVQAIMAHVRKIQRAAAEPEYIDPRFKPDVANVAAPDAKPDTQLDAGLDMTDPRFAPRG
jgi:GTPase